MLVLLAVTLARVSTNSILRARLLQEDAGASAQLLSLGDSIYCKSPRACWPFSAYIMEYMSQ